MYEDSTDISGNVIFSLDFNGPSYRFTVLDDEGAQLLQTVPFKILQSLYRFIIRLEGLGLITNILNFQNLDHNLTYNKTTNLVEFDFNDDANISSQLCLKVVAMAPNNQTILTDECTLEKVGTLTFPLAGLLNGTFQAFAYGFTQNPQPFMIDTLDINEPLISPLAFEGLFIAFFILLLVIGAGIAAGPVPALFLSVIAMVATTIMGIYVVSYGVLAALIFMAILIGVKSRL